MWYTSSKVFQLKCYVYFCNFNAWECPASLIFGDLQIVMNSFEEYNNLKP